jgi:CPA2 family monovalent cation:H+ antiporter-2
LKPLFHIISKTHAVELFTLAVLLITLTAAWLTNILGLSFSLGAFLAGIMLAETEYRDQIEKEIRPFRDILLGLFFISIGMLADIRLWPAVWLWIALLLIALIFGKLVLITLISQLSGNTNIQALRTGLILAQGGEFGFAILTIALTHHMIPADYGQVILAALLISIAIAPVIIYFNQGIALFLLQQKNSK